MKLSKSKQFLADAIHDSGDGWPGGASWAAQDGDGTGSVDFFIDKPVLSKASKYWYGEYDIVNRINKTTKTSPNWHRCVLSREEYFSAYPAELVADADADGWIEWKGGQCPVKAGTLVDVKQRDGDFGTKLHAGMNTYEQGSDGRATAEDWSHNDRGGDIIAYRPHKPETKPDFCESVTRSIPEPDSKPSIEQLAAEYRNKLDYAERLQKEADAAKADAEAKLVELVEAGKAHGLVIGISDVKPDLVITDWRGLRVGDEVECLKVNITGDDYADHLVGRKGVVIKTEPPMKACQPVKVEFSDSEAFWISEWKFIRRP